MNRPEQPIANPPSRPSHLPAPPPPRVPLRVARARALHETEAEERAAVEALIPGGAGIPYTELAEAAGMEGDDLQVILDELQAEGKIDQSVNNGVLCYYHK